MKRHNFKGQGASHGNHKSHRVAGLDRRVRDAGACVQGHEDGGPDGQRPVTTLNLEVVEGDAERGLLLIQGSIPGRPTGLVFVRNAMKAQVRA